MMSWSIAEHKGHWLLWETHNRYGDDSVVYYRVEEMYQHQQSISLNLDPWYFLLFVKVKEKGEKLTVTEHLWFQ